MNCQVELKLPNTKAQYILHNIKDQGELIKTITVETYLKDHYGHELSGYEPSDLLNDFLVTLQIKIGAQDINNEKTKVSAHLILNDTLEISEIKPSDPLQKVR